MIQRKKDVDGDLFIPGSITVLGGINSSAYRKTVTRVATTEADIVTLDLTKTDADDVAAIIAGAGLDAAKVLSISSSAISRSRVGTLTPESLTITARKQDGTTYAGRFRIDISPDGVNYTNAYLSSSDESDYVYTVPADMFVDPDTFYVASVRVELYSAGVDGNFLARQSCSISVDGNTAPIYWGAITTAPTADFLPGDYYWDNNDNGVGTGGTPRIYNGSAWVEFTSAMPGYGNAMMAMLADMGAWATAQGKVVAAASAIFAKLVTADAFIANLFAQQITVGSGGRIQYETGSGVQKRAVRLHDEKIDWVDIPDTSPASAEVLRARIGRLGVGPSILMDGEFNANISSVFGAASQLTTTFAGSPRMLTVAGGSELYYTNASRIRVRYIPTGGVAGSETIITALGEASLSSVGVVIGNNNKTYLAYRSGNNLYLRIREGSVWSSRIDPSIIVSFATIGKDSDGSLFVIYTHGNTLKEVPITSEGSFGTPVTILTGTLLHGPVAFNSIDGALKMAYSDGSSCYEMDRVNGVWDIAGKVLIVSDKGTTAPDISVSITNNLTFSYRRTSDAYYVYVEKVNGVWGSTQTVINSFATAEGAFIFDDGGNVVFAYIVTGTGFLYYKTLQRYARIGGGFIAKGATDYTLFDGAKITVSGTSLTGYIGPTGPTGPTGPQGIQGETGTAATIAVGTVTPGEDPEDASVINSGTSGAAVFDFVLPKGDPGTTVPDISTLTVCSNPDPVNDSLVIYDASSASHKQISPEKLFSPPVGFIYMQLPTKDEPSALFPGEWENISSEFAGDFFRAEGGNADVFGASEQGDAFQGHKVQNTYLRDSYSGSTSGGVQSFKANNVSQTSTTWGGISSQTFITDGVNGTPRTSIETRPVNRTVRIWERIA